MRAVRLEDAIAAARYLLRVPREARDATITRMIEHAHWADLYRQRTGRVHPHWGNGHLGDLARRRGVRAAPPLRDREYLHAMMCVFCALERR